jgi:hypothetical protein
MNAKGAQPQPEKALPAKQAGHHHTDGKEPENRQRNAIIAKQVLDALGQPEELFQVQVRPLFPGRYRVNILVGLNAASVKVAHSYFLVSDSEGNILASTPALTKSYQSTEKAAVVVGATVHGN